MHSLLCLNTRWIVYIVHAIMTTSALKPSPLLSHNVIHPASNICIWYLWRLFAIPDLKVCLSTIRHGLDPGMIMPVVRQNLLELSHRAEL